MPLKCFEKPNRERRRVWKAKNVAQVYCKALEGGESEAEIQKELQRCRQLRRRNPTSEAAEALAVAEQALEQNQTMINGDIDFLEQALAALRILAAIGRYLVRIPVAPARVLGGTAVVLTELGGQRLATLTVQKAANDAALAIVRRAAANEAQFLRAVGL